MQLKQSPNWIFLSHFFCGERKSYVQQMDMFEMQMGLRFFEKSRI